jgi:hypothetical protein
MVSPPRVDQRLLVERWQCGSAIMIKGLVMLKLGTIYITHRRNSTVVSSLRGVAHMRRCSGVGDAPAISPLASEPLLDLAEDHLQATRQPP